MIISIRRRWRREDLVDGLPTGRRRRKGQLNGDRQHFPSVCVVEDGAWSVYFVAQSIYSVDVGHQEVMVVDGEKPLATDCLQAKVMQSKKGFKLLIEVSQKGF